MDHSPAAGFPDPAAPNVTVWAPNRKGLPKPDNRTMRLLIDFFPIALFVAAYKLHDIYMATAVLMAATVVQTGIIYAVDRKLQTLHKVTLALVLVFGVLTLVLQDERFIKWKPTVLYASMAIVLGAALYVEIAYEPPIWLHLMIWLPLAIVLCLGLLRPMKGLAVALQYALGVATLLAVVPPWLGTLHQAVAVLVLTGALLVIHALRRPTAPAEAG